MISSKTYIPSDILKPYIRSLVIQETGSENSYKILPGTGLVIGFQFSGRLSYISTGKETPLSSSGITGLNDHYRVFRNTAGTGTILVNFKEAGASSFFRQPLHELFGESISLDNLIAPPKVLQLEEQLAAARTDEERIRTVAEFLTAQRSPAPQDKLVTAALSLIHQAGGNIRIAELADRLYTSQSPLEKRFRKMVGTTPKKFASIVRLKNAIERYAAPHSLTEWSYESGFYDQAHFIKEFKEFTGATPEKYFRTRPEPE